MGGKFCNALKQKQNCQEQFRIRSMWQEMQNITLEEVIQTQSLQKDWVPPLQTKNSRLELEKKKTRQERAVGWGNRKLRIS